MRFTWSDERMELLTQLIGENMPRSEIGRRLGCGRNAVIGKARRLGLTPDSVLAAHREEIERERGRRENKERLDREREKRRAAEYQLKSANSKLCATEGCRGPKQPGHRLGLCAECDRKRFGEARVA